MVWQVKPHPGHSRAAAKWNRWSAAGLMLVVSLLHLWTRRCEHCSTQTKQTGSVWVRCMWAQWGRLTVHVYIYTYATVGSLCAATCVRGYMWIWKGCWSLKGSHLFDLFVFMLYSRLGAKCLCSAFWSFVHYFLKQVNHWDNTVPLHKNTCVNEIKWCLVTNCRCTTLLFKDYLFYR